MPKPVMLWWGRHDPRYSRNAVLRNILAEKGWEIRDFRPHVSALGDLEAYLRGVQRPDLVWVPCFRQRDVRAAARWARRKGVPLVFDPLISAWDKQVLEFGKLRAESAAAKRLLRQEQRQFACADAVIADTTEHARFFEEKLGVDPKRIHVVYVGAEAKAFPALPPVLSSSDGRARTPCAPLEVFFYGSMLPLQGPETIVAAARLTVGEPIRWTLLGKGPRLDACRSAAEGLPNVTFLETVPYAELSRRIAASHVLLGVFGTTPKAARVMPNKFFQALSSARPVITRESAAYPASALSSPAITFVPPGDAAALAAAVRRFASDPALLTAATTAARPLYDTTFSESVIAGQLVSLLSSVRP